MSGAPAARAASEQAALLAAAQDGDESAWETLVARYTPLVYSVTRVYGLTRADAADVNQTVWLRLVERLGTLRNPDGLASWLATTTRRECYRLLRAGRRTEPFDPSPDMSDGGNPSLASDAVPLEERLLRAERQQALRDAFAELPERCQQLLSLLVADPPLSYREVSQRLGMPVGSIGPTQARCLRRLRQCPALAAFVDDAGSTGSGGGERDAAS